MKKLKAMLVILAIIIIATGCNKKSPHEGYSKYRFQFYDTFDTMVEVVLYAQSDEEFEYFATVAENRFRYLHDLYNIFGDAKGFNNLKTVNDNAGIEAVVVDKELYSLIEFSVDWYDDVNKSVDPTMGPLLAVWRGYIHTYKNDPESAMLPPEKELLDAAKHFGIENIILDPEKQSIFLAKKGMSLDVGAVAKGYATESVALYMKSLGFESFSISAGGNVRTVGEPMSETVSKWGVGIQDPFGGDVFSKENDLLDVAFVNDMSVVSSGDYQRYYMVGGKRVHHIIDKDTLYPANKYTAVTVIMPDSGMADILSTSLYIMEYEDGLKLANDLGAQVIWVHPDGTIKVTDGIIPMLKKRGGASSSRSGSLKDLVKE